MKAADLMASLALHGAVFGAVVWSGLSSTSSERREEIPVFFEIVEDAAPETASSAPAAPVPPVRAAPPVPEIEPVVPDEPDNMDEFQALDESDYLDESDAMDDPVVVDFDRAVATDEPDIDSDVSPADSAPVDDSAAAAGDPVAVAERERAKVVSDPCALNRIAPVYPRAARRKGHEGSVTVEVNVAEDGGIVRAEVVASSGFPELDAAAVSAVRTARFAPATEDGVRVRGLLRLTFDFRLR